MANESYYELLRHPKWQEKRLRVMDRAGFECEECGDKEATLNVHHSYYTKGAKPWEYPDESLRCLCEPCHASRHGKHRELVETVGLLSFADLDRARGYSAGLLLWASAGPDTDDVGLLVTSFEFATGLADAYGLAGNEAPVRIIAECDRAANLITHAVLRRLKQEQASSASGTVSPDVIG